MKLYFDIETVPAAEAQHNLLREIFAAKVAKAAKRGKETEQTVEAFIDQTGLEGEFGRIVCLAYAVDDRPVEVLWGPEPQLLADFWKIAKPGVQFIGHNILEFDLPFIIKRSRIHGIRPSHDISFRRYTQTPVYDTMKEWDLWAYGRQCSLDKLAKAFGLPTSKDTMDGSEVSAYYQAGRIEEICEYCKKDVYLTRQIYKKMNFEETAAVG